MDKRGEKGGDGRGNSAVRWAFLALTVTREESEEIEGSNERQRALSSQSESVFVLSSVDVKRGDVF